MNEKNLENYQNIIDKMLDKQNLTDTESETMKDLAFIDYQEDFALIEKAIGFQASADKLALLNEHETNNHSTPGKKQRSMWPFVVASILAIAIAAFYFLSNPSEKVYDTDLLIADHFTPYPEQNINRGVNEVASLEAMKFYTEHNYEEASIAFAKIPDAEKTTDQYFYEAVSLISIEDYQQAISILENDRFKSADDHPVDFYLGLSYLGNNNVNIAIEKLEASKTYSEYYKMEATDLLSKIQ